MKAIRIKPGDELPESYKVVRVSLNQEGLVEARVQFIDGGFGVRMWNEDAEVPLVRDTRDDY